ncbi:MAG: hypothetical protein CMG33_03350 [Candidatus Marinimicrobia bacterium]|nr:hypothetical protein [Candidatus Neomarinimicrobiota bacterium]
MSIIRKEYSFNEYGLLRLSGIFFLVLVWQKEASHSINKSIIRKIMDKNLIGLLIIITFI